MKLFLKGKYIFLAIVLLFLPAITLAQLVPCGSSTNPCEFSHIMVLINNIIKFLLFNLAIPVAAIMFAAGGFMLMTAGGDSGKISKAKEIFTSVLWGLLIAFLAWIVIHTLLSAAGLKDGYSYLS